jgi:hypothetical protein
VVGQNPQRAAIAASPLPWATPVAGPDGTRSSSWPPADWPTSAQLDYTQKLITVVLLLVALPWLLRRFVRSPHAAGERLASRALP